MTQENGLLERVTAALEDLKAVDMRVLDVSRLTTVTDTMIVASGTSGRHVSALAEKVIETAKSSGAPPLGTEGKTEGEWVLVDLGDIVVHLMLPRVRDFYNLERLWDLGDLDQSRGSALMSD